MKNRHLYIVLFILALSFFSSADTIAQCAMCKAVVKSGSEENASSVGSNINLAILYLMGIPYVLAGFGGYFWWKKLKKNKEQGLTAE